MTIGIWLKFEGFEGFEGFKGFKGTIVLAKCLWWVGDVEFSLLEDSILLDLFLLFRIKKIDSSIQKKKQNPIINE